jgi:hypothetical protein
MQRSNFLLKNAIYYRSYKSGQGLHTSHLAKKKHYIEISKTVDGEKIFLAAVRVQAEQYMS